MREKSNKRHCIWLDNLRKIASFHPEGGFELLEFLNPGYFEHFTADLADSGYRFQ